MVGKKRDAVGEEAGRGGHVFRGIFGSGAGFMEEEEPKWEGGDLGDFEVIEPVAEIDPCLPCF